MSGLRILSAVIFLVVWSGCTSSKESRTPTDKMILTIVGTMHYVDIEGGCWQFRSDLGKNYELIGDSAEQLYIEGSRAMIRIRLRPDLASFCMVGAIAEVVEITEIFTGKDAQ